MYWKTEVSKFYSLFIFYPTITEGFLDIALWLRLLRLVNTWSKSAIKRLVFGDIIRSPLHPSLSKVFISCFYKPLNKKKKTKNNHYLFILSYGGPLFPYIID